MLFSPFILVKQNHTVILERLGKFSRALEPGLNFKLPIFDQAAYQHSLKEDVIDIEHQSAITRDNVKVEINGVLFYKIVDAQKASYNIRDPINAMSSLVQTTMRSEIGCLELDRTFEERELINTNIKSALQAATESWGLEVLRYEIKDIRPPTEIRRSMEFQSESERIKRSQILASEGEKQGKINIAEGYKQSKILKGQGKAAQITQEARSLVESLEKIGNSILREDGTVSDEALRLRLAEQYVRTVHDIFSESKIVVLPKQIESQLAGNNPLSSSSIATAVTIYKSLLGEGIQPTISQSSSPVASQGQDQNMQELMDRINQLEKGGNNKQKQVRYLDDKALFD